MTDIQFGQPEPSSTEASPSPVVGFPQQGTEGNAALAAFEQNRVEKEQQAAMSPTSAVTAENQAAAMTPTLRESLPPLPTPPPSPETPTAIGAVVQPTSMEAVPPASVDTPEPASTMPPTQPETGSHIEPPETTQEYKDLAEMLEARTRLEKAAAEIRAKAAQDELALYVQAQDRVESEAA